MPNVIGSSGNQIRVLHDTFSPHIHNGMGMIGQRMKDFISGTDEPNQTPIEFDNTGFTVKILNGTPAAPIADIRQLAKCEQAYADFPTTYTETAGSIALTVGKVAREIDKILHIFRNERHLERLSSFGIFNQRGVELGLPIAVTSCITVGCNLIDLKKLAGPADVISLLGWLGEVKESHKAANGLK